MVLILKVVASKAVVHSIRISDQAESQVDRLADLTGGFKAYSDGTSSAGLIDAFNLLLESSIEGAYYYFVIFYCNIFYCIDIAADYKKSNL